MVETLAIDYRKLPSYKPLFLDYLHRFDQLSEFYVGDPFSADTWQAVARSLEKGSYPRNVVSASLRELNRELGADDHALASTSAIGEGALAIVTGQQVGLFGGPLYTLYKALTAVRLARSAGEQLGRTIVPLFWMDADDHDFDEVRAAWFFDGGHELVESSYLVEDADSRLPVGSRTLTPSISDTLRETFEALPQSEFSDDVREGLSEAYAPGRTMAEAFGSWLLRLTRGTGLAVVDPSRAELKRAAAGLFEREVLEGSESSAIVRHTTARLLSRGYHAQVNPTESQLNLFYAKPFREPIGIENGALAFPGNGNPVARDEAGRRVREEAECFSPNVLLRPLYQDSLLPTLAYVAGPNELAYFAQLKGVYEHFGVTMPLIACRASFTVVERAQSRFLSRYDVDVTRLSANDESLLNEILQRYTPPQLEEDLSRARRCIQEITSAIARDLSEVDPTLVPSVKSTRGKLFHLLKELEGKALKAVKRKHDTVRSQFLQARTALFPGFEMQERRLSGVGYLNKHGWYFSRLVEDHVDPTQKAHLLLHV
ncbi:MAG TPA: bacillithiol biosynthesis cysteine-adding enzyme BshC [Vicinamibacteria bacterium]|nr:bacillithiol biosynthesis cysteine-adding enzyme BshC [Vicinamibacteria bacterium]